MRRTIHNTTAHATVRRALLRTGMFAALAFAGAAAAQDALTEAQVKAMLEAQGYTRINDVKFKDGTWKADARSADGNRVDLRVDAATGKVYPDTQVANLSKADVEAKLAAAGYVDVHDLDFRDGVWTAEAENDSGKDFELRIDAATGHIIGKRRD
ncbi:PepSY domain-containing protein [Lysobacter hankyongensis]|uniref:PepSY domain-containing protein n=1 Tax=Lysobacter hankyongensis TaxID=1176535 RepID=A0ABP9BJV6_9GAMM